MPIPTGLTPAQFEAHYKFIGGSVAPIVSGLSPWESPLERYYIMRGELAPKDPQNPDALEMGLRIEAVMADVYADRTGRELYQPADTLLDAEHPFIIAHPDRLVVGERRGLECKNTRHASDEKWGPAGTNQVPENYMCQCQHYMRVTGYPVWDLIVLVGGNEPRIYTIPRDDEFIKYLVQIEVDFWNRVQQGIPPDPMTLDDVAMRWTSTREDAFPASAELITLIGQLAGARAAGKQAEADEVEAKLAIANIIQDAEQVVDGDTAIFGYKFEEKRVVDSDLLKSNFPDVYEQVQKVQRSRVARILKGWRG